MLYNRSPDNVVDPIDEFIQTLRLVWDSVAKEYDVIAEIPDNRSLFQDIEIYDPCMAAETILRNMLTDVTQLIDRFSPWYTLPARSFGLVSFRDIITNKMEWRLAPEALKKWQRQIEMLAMQIEQKSGLIDAIVLISDLDILDESPHDSVTAACECVPPKEILVLRAFLESNSIVCNDCKERFVAILTR